MISAECAWKLGDSERGVEWARSAVQAGGGERAGSLLARLLLSSGDVNGALAAYDQALTLVSNFFVTHVQNLDGDQLRPK